MNYKSVDAWVWFTLDKQHIFIPVICFQLVKQNQDT